MKKNYLIVLFALFAFVLNVNAQENAPEIYNMVVKMSDGTRQLFHPLGLGIETSGDMVGEWYQPQMHIEGDILYACTNQGLYSKDLSDDESEWQLVGFEGIPLQDYVRRGEDMLALRHCYYVHSEFLLLSHDDGKT